MRVLTSCASWLRIMRRLRLLSGRGSCSRRSAVRIRSPRNDALHVSSLALLDSSPDSTVVVAWYPFPLSSFICIWPRFEHCLLLSPQHTPYSIAHPEISIYSGIADRPTESCLSVCSFPLEFSSHYEKTSYLPIVERPREVDRFRQTLEGTREIHFHGNKSSV